MRVAITGATGFVGSHILNRLVSEGHNVRALARTHPRFNDITASKETVQFIYGDVVTNTGLNELLRDAEAVIHLVGIIQEIGNSTFEKVHYEGTRNLVAAAKTLGINRFVQMSALGAKPNGVSKYQTTKWKAEEEVRNSGIPHVILRPSIIFGPGDGFVTQMAQLMKASPLIRPVVGSGTYPFQPIWIENAVDCFVQALTNNTTTNRTFELGGPEKLSLDQMLDEIAHVLGVSKPAIHIPFPFMYLNAILLNSVLRRPPVTPDQLRMLREGSICDTAPMMATFKTHPVTFRDGLSRYLGQNHT